MIRSRAKLVLDWEKPSRCFCNMENRKCTCKLISDIEKENNTIISDQYSI